MLPKTVGTSSLKIGMATAVEASGVLSSNVFVILSGSCPSARTRKPTKAWVNPKARVVKSTLKTASSSTLIGFQPVLAKMSEKSQRPMAATPRVTRVTPQRRWRTFRLKTSPSRVDPTSSTSLTDRPGPLICAHRSQFRDPTLFLNPLFVLVLQTHVDQKSNQAESDEPCKNSIRTEKRKLSSQGRQPFARRIQNERTRGDSRLLETRERLQSYLPQGTQNVVGQPVPRRKHAVLSWLHQIKAH